MSQAPPLFTDPSTDLARASFVQRPRTMTDKVMTVAEAVRLFVNDGDYFSCGGFGVNRIPSAVIHELLRQKKQNLAFAGHTTTHDFQMMTWGNLTGRGQLLNRLDISYVVGLEARGLSPHARRVMQSGMVHTVEWSNYALSLRFAAAAMGVPFAVTHSMLGTDTMTRSSAKPINCPFTGEKLAAVPALYPDVVAIHVHEADRYGNCRFRGNSVSDFDKARAGKRVIITCERLVPHEIMRQNPHLTQIPFLCVDAVCEVPYGSYPGNMPGEYFSDEDHLKELLTLELREDDHQKFLHEYIFDQPDFMTYIEKRGGLKLMQQLRHRELLLTHGH